MTVRNQIDIQFTRQVTDQMTNAMRRAFTKIRALSKEELNNPDLLIEIIKAEYDQSVVANSDNLYNLAKSQYNASIRQIQAQIRQQISGYKYMFDRVDTDVLNVLDRNNTLFIGKYFENEAEPRIRAEIAKIISEQQTKAEAAEAIRLALVNENSMSYNYAKMLVETNGTWARSIGKTNALEDAGITEYSYLVTVDDVTSEICLALNGKTNSVQSAVSLKDDYLNIDTSNYNNAIKDLKSISPFIQATEDGFSANGLTYSKDKIMNIPGIELPPFHPNCRTEIVYNGE